MKPCVVYTTGHALNESMSTVLANGFKAKRRAACVRGVTDKGHEFIPVHPEEGTCAIVYGILRGTGSILRDCEERGEDYIYCDHSYFRQTRQVLSQMPGRVTLSKGHFRLVPNDRYYRDLGDMPSDRWERLGIEIKPWRKDGKHVVVVPVSKWVAMYNGFDPQTWLRDTMAELKKHTRRQIIVKPKDSDTPIEDVLENAWALVTMESNAAIDALTAGIPVFAGVSAASYPLANDDLADIEHPHMPDREQHFANLAYQQWTVREIMAGEAKETLEQWGQWRTRDSGQTPGMFDRNGELPSTAPTHSEAA